VKFRIPRRALLAFIAAVALPVAAPAMASAAPTLTVTPTTLQAGGDPNVTSDATFFASPATDSPESVTLALPPGLLTSASANASCLTATPSGSCVIGSGTATVTVAGVGTPVTAITLTLTTPPAASDIAGIAVAFPVPYAGLDFTAAVSATSTGSLVMQGTIPDELAATPTLALSELALTLNGTLNSQPFTRLPTSCGAATTTLSFTSYNGGATPQTAAGAFTPTGCSSLAFTPTLVASATKDSGDDNVLVKTDVTQPAGQAADKTLALTVPAALAPNVTNAVALLNSGKSVGTATANSPLIPATLSGNVTLTGTALAPVLTVTFPAPFPIVLQGTVSLTNSSVTFSDIPDVPLTSLAVTLNGGASGLYQTACNPSSGTLSGAFTGQNGVSASSNSMVAVSGCPTTTTPPPTVGKPTTSGTSLGGLVKNKPKFAFSAIEGKNAKPIKTIAISLPSGISFSSNKKNLKKGIIVKGAGKFTYKVSHGVLTITLSSTATKATVTLESPAISVSSKLAKSVKAQLKKKKVSALSFKVKVTNSGKTTTTLTLKLKPKS